MALFMLRVLRLTYSGIISANRYVLHTKGGGTMRKKLSTITSMVILLFIFLSSAHSTVIRYDLDPFTGDSAGAIVTIDDATAGVFRVNVQVVPDIPSGNIGDITGVFFNLSDTIEQSDITDLVGGPIIGFENNTQNLHGGVNLIGGANNPGLFDVGLRYNGFNVDDVQHIEFLVSSLGGALSLLDFRGFGLRLQSVGVEGLSRGGSSKLSALNQTFGGQASTSIPTPESSTMLLLGIGLIGIAGVARRKAQK